MTSRRARVLVGSRRDGKRRGPRAGSGRSLIRPARGCRTPAGAPTVRDAPRVALRSPSARPTVILVGLRAVPGGVMPGTAPRVRGPAPGRA